MNRKFAILWAQSAGVMLLLSSALSALWIGPMAALWSAAAALLLIVGFAITGLLVAAFLKVYPLSSTSLLLLVSGKLFWWALCFKAARHVQSAELLPVSLGFFGFMISLLWASFQLGKSQQDS